MFSLLWPPPDPQEPHAGYSNTIDRVGYNRPGQKFKKLLLGMHMIFIHTNCMGYLQQILIKQSFKL
jgi:hypothetical protein